LASFLNKPKSVELLLNLGADPTIEDATGRTAEEIAIFKSRKEIIQIFEKDLEQTIEIEQNLYSSKDGSDITFISNDKKEFKLHKCILFNLDFFKNLCRKEFTFDPLLEYSSTSLSKIFEFIYSIPVYLNDMTLFHLFEIYSFSQMTLDKKLNPLMLKAKSIIKSLEKKLDTITYLDIIHVHVHPSCDDFLKGIVEKMMLNKINDEKSACLVLKLF